MVSRICLCLSLAIFSSVYLTSTPQSLRVNEKSRSPENAVSFIEDVERASVYRDLQLPLSPVQNVRVCNERVGTGSCNGYNRDEKRDCGKCFTADTYKCTDGSYAERCTYDPKHCGC